MRARSLPRCRPSAWILALALLAWRPALAQTAPTPAAPARTSGPSTSPASRASPPTIPAAPAAAPAATPSKPAPSPPLAPQGPEYDVEIIVFRAKIGLGSPENWSAEAGTRSSATVSGGEGASGSAQVGELLRVLPPSRYRLTALVQRLQQSGTYAPVGHAAWVQTASAWGTRAGFSLPTLGINVPGLSGTVFLERGEFLHLGMQLDYSMHNPPPGLGAAPGTTFSMNETRRVRFYQTNYYDHPAFGVIALVTPAKSSRPPGR
jgi:hypothetical protein